MDETTANIVRVAWLNEEARDLGHPVVVPRDAATLILVDPVSGGNFRMLMGRRNARLRFMPGAWVFPGGAVDAGDRLAVSSGNMTPELSRLVMSRMRGRPSLVRARALGVAALRETFEETGILIGQPASGRPAGLAGFDDHGQVPHLGALELVARAITPPGRVRRFDTRFFVASTEHISHRPADLTPPSDELDQLAWLSPDEAEGVPLAPITHTIISELVAQRRAAAEGLTRALPFYRWARGRFLRDEIG